MADENAYSQAPEPESREPTVTDVAQLCSELNRRGARDIVIGGFAMRAAGFARTTMDLDLLVDITEDNEARVLDAVATLLWLTKKPTHRAKDFEDLIFLRNWFAQNGKQPPPI